MLNQRKAEPWMTSDSRSLLESWAMLAFEGTTTCARGLVTAASMVEKVWLSERLSDCARLLRAVEQRYVDLRGEPDQLGALWNETRATIFDHRAVASPRECGLIMAAALGNAHRTSAILAIVDGATIELKHELLRISVGLLEPAPDGCDRTEWVHPASWALPRRPGREARFEVSTRPSSAKLSQDPARFIHDVMFSVELCAAELCAAMIAMHAAEAPIGLILDLAQQVADELRHFNALNYLLGRYGRSIGDYPIDTLTWDKFLVGSTLVDRLCIEQRLGEGNGLDGGQKLLRFFLDIEYTEAAQAIDFINADEVMHVRNGNRWLHYLCGGRQGVAQADARVRTLLESAGWPVRHFEPIASDDRALAGFSSDEIGGIRTLAAGRALSI